MLLLPALIASGQPSFRADRVLPSGSARQAPLAPGMLVSIYGDHLGPTTQCSATDRPIYPTELCGVQVFLAGKPAGLLYVSENQINFKVPQDVPLTGDSELKVLHQQQTGTAQVRVGLESTSLSVEGEARVGAPVWIHIATPFGWNSVVQYPVSARPNDFGCNDIEVRRNGVLLPSIDLRPPAGGIAMGGPLCGNIGIEGGPLHTGRLPLHLLYHFTEPGVYEVRYTRRGMDPRDPSKFQLQSEWSPIHVLPRAPGPRAAQAAPAAAPELLSDYLPSLLSFADATALDAVVACLYHPNYSVRTYASAALAYWPQAEADARVDRELPARGPSDMTVEGTLQRHPEMLALVLPYLKSNDPTLLRGVLTGVSRWIYAHPADVQAETALIAAAEHVIASSDEQTVVNYAAALGTVRDPRAGALLWNLVQRNVAREQALIAISWRKDPRDLPRLAALLESPAAGDPLSYKLASLPYALRNSFGDAALPYLESALKNSEFVWVRTNAARELILAGRPSGFAFVAQAIEQKTRYVREMVQFVQDRFPELRGRDDDAVLAFLRAR
uniref:Uncharacterized protein n=1 Tax=Solibacter usitatus (strain Ellin6076) TaxID=234267 RepID=Q01Q32_SOLUE